MTFDMQAARNICLKLNKSYQESVCVDVVYQSELAAEMLPLALDEIERLQAEAEKWRRIGPEEREAIEYAISIIDRLADSIEDDAATRILRRLINSGPDGGPAMCEKF